MIDTMESVVDSVSPVRKFTWKRLILYIVTFFWLFLLIKWLFKLTIKLLDRLREYIHNLTNREKMLEVLFYTFVGIVLGVIFKTYILKGLDLIGLVWKDTILPWLQNLLSLF